MPEMLNDGAVEYEDGTPATESQMGFKWIFVLSLALLPAAYFRRSRWSVLKSRKLVVAVANQLPSTFIFTSQSIPRWL